PSSRRCDGRGAACGTSFSSEAASALTPRLVELRRVPDLLLPRGLVLGVRHGCLDALHLRFHLRLLATLRRDGLVVRARLLDACAAPRARPLGTAARPGTAAPHRPEPFAVLAAAARALAGGAEPLCDAAAAAGGVLVAEARLLAAAGDAAVALGHDLALVDPHLDADPARRGTSLGEAVVDVGANRVQRDAALRVLLGAAHLCAAEPAGALNLHAGRAGADRRRERALHRTAERDTVLELLGDRLRDELRVEFRPLDLVDVDVDVLGGHRVDLLAKRIHLDAGLADHDPGAGGIDVDRDPLLVLPDQDVRQPRVRQLLQDVLPDPQILEQRGREVLLAHHPVRLPVVDDADAQPAGMNLLTHYAVTAFFFFDRRAGAAAAAGRTSTSWSSLTVMWHVRLRIRLTRPRARGRQRLIVGPSST